MPVVWLWAKALVWSARYDVVNLVCGAGARLSDALSEKGLAP